MEVSDVQDIGNIPDALGFPASHLARRAGPGTGLGCQ
jgi:hypothetical protein